MGKIDLKCWKRGENREVLECTIEEVIGFIESTSEIECDTETSGFNPHTDDILCIQFGNTSNQYLIEWGEELVPLLYKYFKSKDKIFIFQNAKFDLQFLYKYDILVANVWDTFLAECILTCGTLSRRSLDVIVRKYLGIELPKEIRANIPKLGLVKEVISYGLDDVKYLSLIKEKQLVEINKYNLENTLKLDNEFVKALAYIEYCGMFFDQNKWLKNVEDNKKIAEELLTKMDNYIVQNDFKKYYNYADLFCKDPIEKNGILYSSTIVWTSPKQVANLFKDIGIKVEVESSGEIKESVGKQVLQQNSNFEIVRLYSEFIKNNKLLTSFGEDYLKFINPVSKRIHTSFKQILNTGRLSSGDKKTNSPNVQQIPSEKRYRECFIPEKGNTLIAADYNGMESVVFANMTMDKNLLDFYDNSPTADMHSYIAKKCFVNELADIPLEEVKSKRPDLRQNAKAAGFSIQFGGNGITISNNLGIPLSEGEATYNAYMNAFTGVKSYFKQVFEKSLKDGYITFNSVTNRKSFFDFLDTFKELNEKMANMDWNVYRAEKAANSITFTEILSPTVKEYFRLKGIIERRSYNYRVQGSSADITKEALIMLFNYIIDNNYFKKVLIPNVVHDEILVECPLELEEEFKNKVVECMELAGSKYFTRVKLGASCDAGDHWIH